MDESEHVKEEPEDRHADPEPMDSEDEPEPMEQDLELEVAPKEDSSDDGHEKLSSTEVLRSTTLPRVQVDWAGLDRAHASRLTPLQVI
ncbi:hypothetical protein NL676_004980 [Syzygium grande]|nr:hypothetical protein NL676_004980 [Syzygium grande]